MNNLKQRIERLEKLIGKGQYEVMTHEGFVAGTNATKRVSKEEYDEHMQWVRPKYNVYFVF